MRDHQQSRGALVRSRDLGWPSLHCGERKLLAVSFNHMAGLSPPYRQDIPVWTDIHDAKLLPGMCTVSMLPGLRERLMQRRQSDGNRLAWQVVALSIWMYFGRLGFEGIWLGCWMILDDFGDWHFDLICLCHLFLFHDSSYLLRAQLHNLC